MIKLDKGPHELPDIFDGGSYNIAERQAAITHYESKKGGSFENYNVYSNAKVKEKLESYFKGKCCYCESYISNHPAEVEHFRPKNSIVNKSGKASKPGYYWLAADWENLLLSCIDCNRQRYHEVPGEKKKMRIGKLDQFPLEDDTKRWTKYDDAEGLKTEDDYCLLVQPWKEDPEQLFIYDDRGLIAPKKDLQDRKLSKAQESIRVFALQRIGLVTERKDYYTAHVKSKLNDIVNYRKIIRDSNENVTIKAMNDMINAKLKELAQLTRKDKPYSAMVRHLLKKDLPDTLGEDLKKHFKKWP